MAKELIKTLNLSKDYHLGDTIVQALREVSLTVLEGEFLAIMGPSGSGKSTAMNLLGCLDTPSSGQFFFDGIDVAKRNADELAEIRNKKIGFVFQNFNLLARTSAVENVQLPLLYAGCNRAERVAAAERVLTEVGLADRLAHQPSQLSGGQQQRVAVARALVNAPALILADEPTGALDTRTGIEIMALFQKLNRAGMTVIIITHEAEVARFADRLLRFQDGRIIKEEINPAPVDGQALLAEFEAPGEGVAE